MRRAFVPRGPLAGAWRGALLVALLLLADGWSCTCRADYYRWACPRAPVVWHQLDGRPWALVLLGAGVGIALGAALAPSPPPAPGARSRVGRPLALAAVHAAGLAAPLLAWVEDDWDRRIWIAVHVQATTPLELSRAAASTVFAGSVGAALFLACAAWTLRWTARGPLGTATRLGVAASGLSVAIFCPFALHLVR